MCASSRKLFWLIVALLAALASVVGLNAALNPAQKHMSGQACPSCHLPGNEVNKENAHLLVAPQEKLCAEACHTNSVQISHPSGIHPALAVPSAYPLDWKGDMTCSTCHNVHGNTPGLMRGSARGRNLCLSCHDRGFFDKMADQGMSMISSGHMSSATAKIDLSGLDVDPFTVQCMGCHGDYTDKLGTTIDSKQVLRHADKSVSHPIGQRYSASFMKGRYRPESSVNQKLFLPDGRLSCVSCHQGYTKEHGKLRMSNRGSALCFECHDI
ncbi:MAG: cytochrome c3 family protein [Gallionellaceae bacterium]|nr:cytochrome c3 family protein [Gallionellaceae bacterium]